MTAAGLAVLLLDVAGRVAAGWMLTRRLAAADHRSMLGLYTEAIGPGWVLGVALVLWPVSLAALVADWSLAGWRRR